MGKDKLRRVIMITLDGFNPDLVYKWENELSNLGRIMNQGIHGKIKSTIPPLPPPAWGCVLSGKNPGNFGYWDSTYRSNYSYRQSERVTSKVTEERIDTLYKILSEHGKRVAMVDVPFAYPPPKVLNGYSISSPMTPGPDKGFTCPPSLQEELKKIIGEYIASISGSGMGFRAMNRDVVLEKVYGMDRQRFDLTKYFIEKKNCDFILTAVLGSDRISHSFYRYFDKNHPLYTPDSKYKNVLKDYYQFCDKNIGEIMRLIDEDTAVIILSSYGVQRLDGRINLNEWLIQEGYLKLKTRPRKLTPLMHLNIDWSRTEAWTIGYTGQLYLNVKGREPQGAVDPKDYDKCLNELTEKLKAIPGKKGEKLDTEVYKRKNIHSGKQARFGPDLFVSFNNYHLSTSDLVGYDSLHSYNVPQGSDDGAHGPYGFFALFAPDIPRKGKVSKADLLDIAPTVLDLFGVSLLSDMEGEALTKKEVAYSKEEKEMRERLSRLGYLG